MWASHCSIVRSCRSVWCLRQYFTKLGRTTTVHPHRTAFAFSTSEHIKIQLCCRVACRYMYLFILFCHRSIIAALHTVLCHMYGRNCAYFIMYYSDIPHSQKRSALESRRKKTKNVRSIPAFVDFYHMKTEEKNGRMNMDVEDNVYTHAFRIRTRDITIKRRRSKWRWGACAMCPCRVTAALGVGILSICVLKVTGTSPNTSTHAPTSISFRQLQILHRCTDIFCYFAYLNTRMFLVPWWNHWLVVTRNRNHTIIRTCAENDFRLAIVNERHTVMAIDNVHGA